MSEKPEAGDFHFVACLPQSGDLTIHDDKWTANNIADGLKEGILFMGANHFDDFEIVVKDSNKVIASVDNLDESESYLDGYLFIEDE